MVTPVLVGKLNQPGWHHEAPLALGKLRAVEAVPALCERAGKDKYDHVEIDTLGKIGSPDALPTLEHLARHSPHVEVRCHALRALRRIGDPRAVETAMEACDDIDPTVRVHGARTLVAVADQRAVGHLIRLCDTHHATIAVTALTRIADPRALPTLWELLRTTRSRRLRHAVGRAIAATDGPYQDNWHYPWSTAYHRSVLWLLGYKPDWSPHHLVTALDNSDPRTRAEAVTALGRRRQPTDPLPVRKLLDDPHPRVRNAASSSLKTLTRTSG